MYCRASWCVVLPVLSCWLVCSSPTCAIMLVVSSPTCTIMLVDIQAILVVKIAISEIVRRGGRGRKEKKSVLL